MGNASIKGGERLRSEIWNALHERSGGGVRITDAELKEIQEDGKAFAPELIARLVEMLNKNDGVGYLDADEINALQDEFSEQAAGLLDSLGAMCAGPSGMRLFAPSAEAVMNNACADGAELVSTALNDIGFSCTADDVIAAFGSDVDSNRMRELVSQFKAPKFVAYARRVLQSYEGKMPLSVRDLVDMQKLSQGEGRERESMRDIVVSDGFVAFARMMHETYDTYPLRDVGELVGIYLSPRALAAYSDPKNRDRYQQASEVFGWRTSPYPPNLDIVEGFGRDDRFHERLTAAEAACDTLNEAYPGRYSIDGSYDLNFFMRQIEEPKSLRIIEALTSPRIRDLDAMLQKQFGVAAEVGPNETGLLWLDQFLADDPQQILALKGLDPVFMADLVGDDYPDRMRKRVAMLPRLKEERVRNLIARFESRSWHDMDAILALVDHPRFEEIQGVFDRMRYIQLDGVVDMMRIADDPDRWNNFIAVLDHLPEVALGTEVDGVIDWLGQPETLRQVESNELAHVGRRLQKHWKIAECDLDDVSEIMELHEDERTLLFDSAFESSVRKVHALLGSGRSLSLSALSDYLQMGKDEIDRVLAPESLHAMKVLRHIYPYFSVDSWAIDSWNTMVDAGLDAVVTKLVEWEAVTPGRAGGVLPPIAFNRSSLEYLFEKMPDVAQRLCDPQVEGLLKRTFQDESVMMDSPVALMPLITIAEDPDAGRVIAGISQIIGERVAIGFHGGSEWDFVKGMMHQDEVRALISDPGFHAFCVELRDHVLMPPTLGVTDIPVLARLYLESEARGRDAARSFQTKAMKRMVGALKRDFAIKRLDPDMLVPIRDVAEQYDEAGIADLCRQLGRRPHANDIALLGRVARDDELKALLFDRDALLEKAGVIYARASKERVKFGSPVPDPTYTERPSREALDNLALLRLVLLDRTLADPKARAELGQIVARDIQDKSTEYGGLLLFEKEGSDRLVFNHVRSISEDDGSYMSPLSAFLSGGAMTYHLHALDEDHSPYSGPSGRRGQDGADWGYVRSFGGTDVVVTTCGRSQEHPDQLLVNVDMYYYDQEGVGRVIDLGLIEVPVSLPQ